MRNKIDHVIFMCGGWELIEGVFISPPQVIVFLNHDKFNQLPADSCSPNGSFLIRKRGEKKSQVSSRFFGGIAPRGVLHLPNSENVPPPTRGPASSCSVSRDAADRRQKRIKSRRVPPPSRPCLHSLALCLKCVTVFVFCFSSRGRPLRMRLCGAKTDAIEH